MRANLKNDKSDQRIAESFEDLSWGGSPDFGETVSLERSGRPKSLDNLDFVHHLSVRKFDYYRTI